MQKKVVFVDWDGTLSNSRFWENSKSSNLTPEIVAQFTRFLFKDSPELVRSWMRGFVSSSKIATIIADQFDLDAEELHSELERSCRNMALVDDYIPQKIRKLQAKGLRVVIATDNMDTFENWTVPSLRLDELFDGILTSPTRGALKADLFDNRSQFFDLYLTQQGVRASETILLDDSPNYKTLKTIGMDYIQISNSNKLVDVLDSITTT